ncbi:hypothetical protein SESBI_50546 [Sesbania bispinosa]|nr:hypothetical protein SESBI_50546 [Sesbania bispinosa]
MPGGRRCSASAGSVATEELNSGGAASWWFAADLRRCKGERLSLTMAHDWLPGRRWLHAQCATELQPVRTVKGSIHDPTMVMVVHARSW